VSKQGVSNAPEKMVGRVQGRKSIELEFVQVQVSLYLHPMMMPDHLRVGC
jgi:hypothetical protein